MLSYIIITYTPTQTHNPVCISFIKVRHGPHSYQIIHQRPSLSFPHLKTSQSHNRDQEQTFHLTLMLDNACDYIHVYILCVSLGLSWDVPLRVLLLSHGSAAVEPRASEGLAVLFVLKLFFPFLSISIVLPDSFRISLYYHNT